jgi:large-conductance mechanosensitive channel
MQFFTGVLNRITQEDGSLPGEPLGTFLGIVYFLVIPTILFIVISAVVALSTVDRRKNKSSTLTRID